MRGMGIKSARQQQLNQTFSNKTRIELVFREGKGELILKV